MPFFFPRTAESSPFFQLINEIERASQPQKCQPRQHTRTFTPSFDVKETKEAYQLYGELPGLKQSDVNIDWADDKTITISGRSERRYKTASVEPATSEALATVEAPETTPTEDGFEEITNEQASYQKPSVEDEGENSSATASPSDTADKTSDEQQPQQETAKQAEAPAHKYWIAERSVGAFERTFQFPIRVEHDEVKASLKNGILSITIPKAKPLEPRKIVIQ